MRNYATSCWPCIRKNSTRWRKFWRLDNNVSPSAQFPESAVASRTRCWTVLHDAALHGEAHPRRKFRPGTSFEGFSPDGGTRRRPVRARGQDFRHDPGAGQLTRGSGIFRGENQNRSSADWRRSSHQDYLSRGREEVVSLRQELFVVRQL